MNLKAFVGIILLFCTSCGNSANDAQATAEVLAKAQSSTAKADSPVVLSRTPVLGADQYGKVQQALKGKRVGLVVNHTSTSGDQHLVDRLHADPAINVVKVFGPEHGFRGEASDGEKVTDQRDTKTGLPIISLYGKTKKPTKAMLEGLDIIVFDIQDVGLRFYTYISTMHYVMDAAAEHDLPVLILDRPNPNGQLTDGPILKPKFKSFIGMHPIPVAHGLTVGELAQMINGEGWLTEGQQAKLTIISVLDYQVGDVYELPIQPSPNLPNQTSIYLYPTLCFFEGTVISVGRGTDFPFQVIGHPKLKVDGGFAFTPTSRAASKYPKLENKACRGIDLRVETTAPPTEIDFEFVAEMMAKTDASPFINRNDHFDKCAGTDALRKALTSGMSMEAYRASYADELAQYLEMRKAYLLYERS
ncbi:MAG: exo-beta-N-acetylmuramidase NamZ domain-containing protein [Saprospiraceae bacterium]